MKETSAGPHSPESTSLDVVQQSQQDPRGGRQPSAGPGLKPAPLETWGRVLHKDQPQRSQGDQGPARSRSLDALICSRNKAAL